ncbi:MAG: uracil-DNA glycosylase [bacterium]|nr:uracil-DNA glycosylase [bacterium]
MDNDPLLERFARSISAIGVKRIYLRNPVHTLVKNDEIERNNRDAEKNMSKSGILKAEQVQVEDCRACDLHKTRAHTVYADGSDNADLMFIGEAPGAEEDKTGLPFVGRAGKLLDRILGEVGLNRSEVYICNTLKCRPPDNRDPLPEESTACAPFLKKQIAVVDPGIIVTLGLPAIRYFVPGNEAMGKLRERTFQLDKRTIIPTYHPAAALRFPAYKEQIFDDIKKARDMMIKKGLI